MTDEEAKRFMREHFQFITVPLVPVVEKTERHYTFIEDPGHGWLEVPLKDIQGTGLTFSKYSPRRNGFIYLEEDCDAPRFLDYLKTKGITVVHHTKQVERFRR